MDEDLIHDVAFNHYGRRLATCSADQYIRVWDMGDDGTWKPTASWKAHLASVWKLAWAHPQYGHILASCSEDSSIKIWEEQERLGRKDEPFSSSWHPQAKLVEPRKAVRDVRFSPSHHGLKLAAASQDGFVRVYEAIDIMNLIDWPLQEYFEADPEGRGVNCISWGTARYAPPTLVVGCASGSLRLWQYDATSRQWQVLASLASHAGQEVRDVSWAPHSGRSHDLIASASQDCLRIFVVHTDGAGGCSATCKNLDAGTQAEVWRVEWNITGTVLAASQDDGVVLLWKAGYGGDWVCVTEMGGTDVGTGP